MSLQTNMSAMIFNFINQFGLSLLPIKITFFHKIHSISCIIIQSSSFPTATKMIENRQKKYPRDPKISPTDARRQERNKCGQKRKLEVWGKCAEAVMLKMPY